MFEASVNFWAVLAATVVSMVLGFAWYSQSLFGKAWLRAQGKSTEQLEAEKKGKSMGKIFFLNFLAALLTAYVLGVFLGLLDARSVSGGVQVGFWIWLGFVGTVQFVNKLYSGESKEKFMIDTGYQLVSLLLMGGILAGWR
ncbi:DUF1761 domain-containing protein [Candidatus Parcubacteria bacterium]|nr:MAG: DUF1761 domain-containing protein [Candidatus Parcubacteria bacterium]